ncbi:hypothetical protein MM1S1540310_4000 [Mycobacteroides abscessus subsp. bolletii 1S-154-0310]|nr:hypothetical protein MM1S1520914_4652 [Mycobacteroides abscessus subsp. bolletii 1S-152-0914]EIU71196.1 hypothetical protein MM1S1530915_3996 [Mycobacteroides abscessus subsp. bolletii 1S-153-0915]EIU81165.1 hypothetical protein MM1S1540310_4000 [Mycobacteroides abscessus subsp. bolletii 1S-154-0310]
MRAKSVTPTGTPTNYNRPHKPQQHESVMRDNPACVQNLRNG